MKPLSYFIHFSQSKKYIHSIIPILQKKKLSLNKQKKSKKIKSSGHPALPHSYI